ncbi:MAG: wax ester/triacylglycerol synthase family O-acyltransferase, partial [Acidimicrobiia bacterium]
DVKIHVRRCSLGPRVDAAALAAFASSLDETPLDPNRPLWEMHVVEGLDDGNIAVVAKLHHALMDGMAGMGFMASLFSFAPEAPEPPPRVPREAERPPGQLALLAGALPSLARLPVRAARAGLGALVGMARTGWLLAGAPGPLPNPATAPRTVFNVVASGRRDVAYTSLALDDMRAVKQAFGVTVNDVVLAVVSGALRAYLAQRGTLPDRPLVAAVPVALRGDDDTDRANAVSLMFTSLATDVEHPGERLRAVHDATRAAKQLHEAIGPEFLPGLSGVAPPFALATIARLYGAALVGWLPVACHALISNVAGPPVPMYFAGARVVALYPLGPLFPGIGLNVTVVSCEDSVGFGAVVCPDAVPDVWDLVHGFAEELARLTKAARVTGRPHGR